MPNSKQATKRMRNDAKRRLANKTLASSMKTAVKRVVQAEDAPGATVSLASAMKRIDKAAKARVIHPNTAARKKSQLARAIAAKQS